ncbi:MAG TPA: hypothetical protein VF050_06100 [Moraxellaceae bacterium]
MSTLPPPGQWAIGADRAQGEALLALARAQGLRSAWLGAEAGFLSNLNVLENLRLMHDWHGADSTTFGSDLEKALAVMELQTPEWLLQRPSELLDSQLIRARLLRVLLLRPEVMVLSPVTLALAGDALTAQLVAAFGQARIFLLGDAVPNWPAWPPHDMLAATSEDVPA